MYFYRHNKFGYIIMMKDLSEIETPKQFKDFMDKLNKLIESKKENEVMASSLDNDSMPDDEDMFNRDTGAVRFKTEILWAFTNADKMKQDFWNRLEPKMLDIYQSHPGIRFLVTTNCDLQKKKKFEFTCFLRDEEL